jgi:hypothetical protein
MVMRGTAGLAVMLVPLEYSEVGPREGREVQDPGEKRRVPVQDAR